AEAEERSERRIEGGGVGTPSEQWTKSFGRDIRRGGAGRRADELGDRLEARPLSRLAHGRAQERRSVCVSGERIEQAGLADPRFPYDRDEDRCSVRGRLIRRTVEPREVPVPTDEG